MVETLLERVVPAQFDSVSSLRRETDAFLQSAEDRFRASVLLVVSELSTNAVEALGEDGGAQFTLRIRNFADRVEIEVSDPGPGFARAFGRPGAAASDPRGRGLQVVQSLADRVTVQRNDGQTTVRCVMCREPITQSR